MPSQTLGAAYGPALALRSRPGSRFAAGLGWVSLGLGVAQLFWPGTLARLIGRRDDERGRRIVRAIASREIAVGVGLLARGPARWLWAQVLGDVLDLYLLGKAARNPGTKRALESERPGKRPSRARAELCAAVTIGCSRDVAYTFWRDFENLPRFIAHLEAVRAQNGHSRWWARAAAGIELKWDAEITIDRPGELIAWQSLRGSDLPSRGAVRFLTAPGGRGTEVHLTLAFEPRGGRLAGPIGKLLATISEQQLRSDLRRLKQLLETSDVARSGQSAREAGVK